MFSAFLVLWLRIIDFCLLGTHIHHPFLDASPLSSLALKKPECDGRPGLTSPHPCISHKAPCKAPFPFCYFFYLLISSSNPRTSLLIYLRKTHLAYSRTKTFTVSEWKCECHDFAWVHSIQLNKYAPSFYICNHRSSGKFPWRAWDFVIHPDPFWFSSLLLGSLWNE